MRRRARRRRSSQLRARLRDAMVAAETDAGRAAALQTELDRSREEAEKVERELFAARRARDAAAAAAETIAAKMAEAESNFAAERDAYESVRSRAVERERARDAAELERARAELGTARAATAAAEAKLRETTADGADGRAALKAALELREREAETCRMRSDEARRRCATLEETTRALEDTLARTRHTAEKKVMELERALAAEKAARAGAERAEATGGGGGGEDETTRHRRGGRGGGKGERGAKGCHGGYPTGARARRGGRTESRRENRSRAFRSGGGGGDGDVRRRDDVGGGVAHGAGKHHQGARRGVGARGGGGETRKGTSGGTSGDETSRRRRRLERRRRRRVRSRIGRTDAGGVGGASFGVFAFDENAVDVKRAELAKIEGKVTVAKERLRATEEAALAAAAAAATTRTPTSNGGSRELPGASLPTPRTRARTALRLSRGPAPVATEKSPDAGGDARRRSPGSEIRRRAVAMGLRASPFAPKRKRGGER